MIFVDWDLSRLNLLGLSLVLSLDKFVEISSWLYLSLFEISVELEENSEILESGSVWSKESSVEWKGSAALSINLKSSEFLSNFVEFSGFIDLNDSAKEMFVSISSDLGWVIQTEFIASDFFHDLGDYLASGIYLGKVVQIKNVLSFGLHLFCFFLFYEKG